MHLAYRARELNTVRGHNMMPPTQHVRNGLACPAGPADESMLVRDNVTDIETMEQATGHSDNIIASAAHSLRRHKQGKERVKR